MNVSTMLAADAETLELMEPTDRSLDYQRVLPNPLPCSVPRCAITGWKFRSLNAASCGPE